MCGIAGYVNYSSEVSKHTLNSMMGEIVYRGPDSTGKFLSKSKRAALGIQRLSILDLKTGDQPISNEDGTVTVVFNGEIYNYKDLKKQLLKDGHKFKTNSDTEVLVHLYEKYGKKMPKFLNGMFAFAIWDEKKQSLFLARDRAGIKPLYYFISGKQIVFGSEVKTILKHSSYKKEVDRDVLQLYLSFGYIPGEKSIFKNIYKLLPGHSLTFSKSGIQRLKFFDLPSNGNEGDISLDKLIEKSVSLQLQADVPVGVLLSGGLDSSLIAYYIGKVKKLKSFSIGFDEASFDESKHAYAVAKKIGTEHYNETFSSKDAIDIYKVISGKLDEPLADASILPTYKVCKLARKHVKVVLSGDGGDELFGGYPTYQAHIIAEKVNFLPKILFNSAIAAFDLLPASNENYSKKDLATIFLKGIKMPIEERHLYIMKTFFLGENTVSKEAELRQITKLLPKIKEMEKPYKVGQIIDFYTYLRDDFLIKTDRASMYN
ncbi:MAG: asparagine synthase (glutamine-hydrolyzing), partial [Microgenomates group bacterium]